MLGNHWVLWAIDPWSDPRRHAERILHSPRVQAVSRAFVARMWGALCPLGMSETPHEQTGLWRIDSNI